MAIKNTKLGGTDWGNEKLLYPDLNDTNDRMIDTYIELNKQRYGDSVLTGCLIEEQGTPDQTAKMSAGKVLVSGLYYSIAADDSISFTNADATNPRWDLVSVDSSGTVTVTDGTAAATPVAPSLPSDDVPLAMVYRAATDNVINEADIYDVRRLVDTPYQISDITRDEDNSDNSWQLEKTLTIPAYRLQKFFKIKYDLSCRAVGALGTSDSDGTVQVRINIDDGTTSTDVDESTNWYYSSDGADEEIFTSDTGVFELFYTSSDYDLTKNITIKLYLKGEDDITGLSIYGVNYMLYIEGE